MKTTSCGFITSEASTKSWMRTEGILDKYLNIIEGKLGAFRAANAKFSKFAKENYGVDERLFFEEQGGKKAVPNKTAFYKIDAAKGVFYKENEYLRPKGKTPPDVSFYKPVGLPDNLQYQFRAITTILANIDKIRNWEKNKSISTEQLYKKIQELGIPSDQLNLVKASDGSNVEEKLASFVANYSYTIEINTKYEKTKNYRPSVTKEEVYNAIRSITDKNDVLYDNYREVEENDEYPNEISFGENKYGLKLDRFIDYGIENHYSLEQILNDIRQHFHSEDGEWFAFNREGAGLAPQDRDPYNLDRDYSHMTVPGGTNYTENEIATQTIKPSIKGHAAFATDKGIGWFRSDDRTQGGKYYKDFLEASGIENVTVPDLSAKTRRILEVQSDLFQKGRDKKQIAKVEEIKVIPSKDKEYNVYNIWKIRIGDKVLDKEYNDIDDAYDFIKQYNKENPNYENEFLQLLNKDNNWVTFFVKSIIQDSAKKGYEKVLFPTGNTASKVEGHTTLEEFKKQQQDRLEGLTDRKNNLKIIEREDKTYKWGLDSDGIVTRYLTKEDAQSEMDSQKESLDREINNVKQELERVEKEGFGALKPIYNFYQNTVYNVLRKQGYNPSLITDEYGNTWFEVNVIDNVSKFEQPIDFFRQQAQYQSQYSVLDNPITLNLEQNKKVVGNEVLRKLTNRLESSLGVKSNIITANDAFTMLAEYGIEYSNEPGFFFNGEVYFIEDKVTSELILHEFSHPLIKSMRTANPQLFEKLYDQLKGTPEGDAIIQLVKDRYSNQFKEGTDDFKEEVIVRALSAAADAEFNNKPQSTGFIAWVKEILYNLKQFFRKLFPGEKIKIESLSIDTSLEELAQMLLSKDFQINTEIISLTDVAEFSKEVKDQLRADIQKLNNDITRQTISNFTRRTRAQLEKIDNINTKDLKVVLKDNLGRSDLAEILNSLKPFNVATEPVFTNPVAEFNYMQQRAEAMVNALLRLEMISERMLEHFKKLAKNPTPENVAKAYYYTSLIIEWEGFATDFRNQTRKEQDAGNINASDPIVKLANTILENFARTEQYRNSIQLTGSEEVFTNQLQGMIKNINDHYEKLLEYKTRKGAPAREINRIKKEAELVKLDNEKIKSLLRGDLGDAHPLNSWFESYMYNQDPIIFGFAQYVTDNFMDMHAEIQEEFNKFINELDPLLDKAGYKTALERLKMGKDMLMEDERRIDAEGNDKKVLTFITPFKNYINKIERLEKAAALAKDKVNRENTDESKVELAAALKAVRDERSNFWHQPFTAAYYERYKLFDSPIGQLAYAKQQEILSKIQGLNTSITDFEELSFIREQEELFWKEYQFLANETYEDGSPKVDSPDDGVYDLSIAKILQQFRNETKKFYEPKEKTGLFNTEYIKFVQSLEGLDPNSKEYNDKMRTFLENNTIVSLSDEYYNDLSKIFVRLKALAISEQDKKIVALYEERSALLSGNRDENRQPIGNQMNINVLKRLTEIEKEITALRKAKVGSSGLTGYELDTYLDLKAQVEENQYYGGEPLSDDNAKLFLELDARYQAAKEKGLSDNDIEMREALSDLSNMQKRVLSSYYIDTINGMITPQMREVMKNELNLTGFDQNSNIFLENYDFITKLKAVSPAFAAWHEANHTLVEYKSKGRQYRRFKPSSAWTYTVPKNPKHYKSTVIYDTDGTTIIDIIPRVPNKSYFYRAVRKEVDGVSIITPRITYLDCIKQGIPLENATIDMNGNFLPRADVANSPYKNEKYYELMKDKDKYNVLLALLKNHLSYQQTLPYDSRLDIESPRFRKENLEIIASRREKVNPIVSWIKNLRSYFASAPDDLEDNLNPSQELMVVNADLYDTDYTKIPINGIYDLEIVETSEDVLRGIMRYMQSAKRQKKLLEILPYAKAIQSVVNNPDNRPNVIGATMTNMKSSMLNAASRYIPINKEHKSVRAAAINAFIEREFEGKTQAGMLAQYTPVQKVADSLMKISSFAFFAFNIPSALKNAWGARFQSMIEASAGKYFGWQDYTVGSAWASKVTAEISFQIYKKESRSVDVQLVELMDPSQGRFTQSIREGVGTTRSALTDLTDSFKYGTNIRKWTELNATLSVFGAMLKNTKIKRTLSNGQEQTITYDQAWEVVDGVIQLKDGIDKKWDKGGSEYKNFVRKTKGVINNLNGAFSTFDQPGAGRWLLYRFVMYIKTYFTRMFMHRFQAKIKGNFFTGQYLPRYDAYTNDIALGFYLEGIRALFDIIKSKGAGIKSMHPDELRSLRRMIGEVGLLTILNMVIINLLFGFDQDDDDRYEKLRAKSGSLPLPFVTPDPDRPFQAGGYLSNHLLSLILQIRSENEAWMPLPNMGLDEYTGILTMEAVPMAATVTKYVDLLDKSWDALQGDKSAYYQRDVGPYDWQKAESLKMMNYALKSIGVTGKIVDPVLQAETTIKLRNADILGN